MAEEVSKCFDNPNRAMAIIFACLKFQRYGGAPRWIVVSRDGSEFEIDDFTAMHLRGYQKRVKYETPHSIGILEIELVTPSSYGAGRQSSGGRKPNLDQTEGNVEEWF